MKLCWIPDLVVRQVNEDFEAYENRIYKIFHQDFICTSPIYHGMRVSVRRKQQEVDGKWAGFVHLTTVEDHATDTRVTDLHRCERIKYIRAIIDYCDQHSLNELHDCEDILIWKVTNTRTKRDRVKILVPSEYYLIVLEPHENKGYCQLITAYHLDFDNTYEKNIREYRKLKGA